MAKSEGIYYRLAENLGSIARGIDDYDISLIAIHKNKPNLDAIIGNTDLKILKAAMERLLDFAIFKSGQFCLCTHTAFVLEENTERCIKCNQLKYPV